MKALPLTNATRRLGAPPDWDHERQGPCHPLEICDVDGFMVSCWQPTDDELRRLNAGVPVSLQIRGNVHPVVALHVPDVDLPAGAAPDPATLATAIREAHGALTKSSLAPAERVQDAVAILSRVLTEA